MEKADDKRRAAIVKKQKNEKRTYRRKAKRGNLPKPKSILCLQDELVRTTSHKGDY